LAIFLTQKLIIFTRYPEPGRSKTRLIPALGPRGAAELQKRMTGQTVATARQTVTNVPAELEIRYTGGNREAISGWLGNDLDYRKQGPGDLGNRLTLAFADSFAEGYRYIIIIGSDCPALTPAFLVKGFKKLLTHDLVLGPATDGGYYLVGLSRPCPGLFKDLAWGGCRVLPETLDIAVAADLSIYLLEELADVDRPADLHRFSGGPDLQ